jgi:tight adherence protein C
MSLLPLTYMLLLAACFASAALFAHALLCLPLPPEPRLGIRGRSRMRSKRMASFASVEPMLRALGAWLEPRLGRGLVARIDRRLTLAGDWLGLLPGELVALSLSCATVVLVAGGAYVFLAERRPTLVLVAALLFGLLPTSRLSSIERERRVAVDHGVPPLIDVLVLGLSAGLDLPAAVRQVVDESLSPEHPLIEELGFFLHELSLGKTRTFALEQLAERLPTPSMCSLVHAIIQAERHGNPLARVLSIHAEVSRRERSTRAEEAAAKAGVRMMLPLVLVFAAILILMAGPMFLSANASI